MVLKVVVENWFYHDGMRDLPSVLLPSSTSTATMTQYFDEGLKGWHAQVREYCDTKADSFENWMKRSMKGKYESTFRFNSGDPMYFVTIYDEEDATLFKLTWECGT